MLGYSQNPYILANSIHSSFNFWSWLGIVLSNPFKYFFVVISSMTGLVFIEGFYDNITGNFNTLAPTIFFAGIKILFAYYIWSNIIRNFQSFLSMSLKAALLSIAPLIYFVLVVGNFPVEQRYFYPLLPWVYFYAALDKEAIKNLYKIFANKL